MQHSRKPLQPRAGINRRLRQRRQLIRHTRSSLASRICSLFPVPCSLFHHRRPIKLHEDQIPNLHVPRLVLAERKVHSRRLRRLQPHVVKNLRARPARPRLAHLPKIIFKSVRENPLLGHADFDPVLLRLIIARNPIRPLEDRHVQPLHRNLEAAILALARNQLPGKADHLMLEVVSKAEIPQHLKKRMMPPCKPHVLQVVVLPSGAHALLRGRRPRVLPALGPQKQVLELVHPRVGKQQRGVVGRHQRGRVHPPVPLRLKKAQKRFANLISRHFVLWAIFHSVFSVSNAAYA